MNPTVKSAWHKKGWNSRRPSEKSVMRSFIIFTPCNVLLEWSSKGGWDWQGVVCMEEWENAYRFLIENSGGDTALGRLRCEF
jgi:hypothetical protein